MPPKTEEIDLIGQIKLESTFLFQSKVNLDNKVTVWHEYDFEIVNKISDITMTKTSFFSLINVDCFNGTVVMNSLTHRGV